MKIPALVIPLFCIAVLAAFLLGGMAFPRTVYIKEEQKPLKLLPSEQAFSSQIKVPAVDDSGNGVVTEVGVNIEPGSGRTLASIENILFFVDTQDSIRTARAVAGNLTGVDLSQHDLIYTIKANASVIEGPSAGAALTIATIAALEGKRLNPEVMITGTISPDGKIGPVGQVTEKAAAARENGAQLFLIPRRGGFPVQSFEYERVTECRDLEGVEFCETRYVRKEKKGGSPGIEVKEVSTIQEALGYFIMEGQQ